MLEYLNSWSGVAHAGAELFDDFLRRPSRFLALAHIKGDRSHPRMSTAAVAFANLRQVHHRWRWRPGIRSHGNFYPEAALAQPNAIDGLGVQIVRNKFVVAFQVKIGDVKKERPIF